MDFDLSGLEDADRMAAFFFLKSVSLALDCGMCSTKEAFTKEEEKELEELASLFSQSMMVSPVAHEAIRLLQLFSNQAAQSALGFSGSIGAGDTGCCSSLDLGPSG